MQFLINELLILGPRKKLIWEEYHGVSMDVPWEERGNKVGEAAQLNRRHIMLCRP